MKKIILGLIIFFGIINNSFAFDISSSTSISSTAYSSICSGVIQYKITDSGNRATFGCANQTNAKSVTLSIPYDPSSFTLDKSFNTGLNDPSIKIYGNGTTMFISGWSGTAGYLRSYSLSTPFDITTGTLIYNKIFAGLGSTGFSITDDGLHLLINSATIHYHYIFGTAWDLSTLTLSSSGNFQVGGNSYTVNGYFTPDGNSVFIGYSFGSYGIRQYNLSIPFNLTSSTYFSNLLIGTTYGLDLADSGTKLYFSAPSYGNNINYYNTNDSFGPPSLAFTSTGIIVPIQDGFTLSGAAINVDYEITNIDIVKYYSGTAIQTGEDIRVISQTGSGGVEVNLDILSDADFIFQAFQDYEIKITFKTLDGLESIYNWYTYGNYIYNGGYIDPGTISFNFFVNGYTFFENGFSFDNFIPTPSGGLLYFEIIAPAITGTGTINETTNTFGPYETDGNGYGIDTNVKVTYPYHQVSGAYQVRTVYKYQDTIIYPFGTDYNSYEISVAERGLTDAEIEELNFTSICDTNLDGISDIGESLMCPITIFQYYSGKVRDNITGLKKFLNNFINIGTDEVKTFSFIGSAKANFMDGMQSIDTQNNFGSKMYYFIKGFLYFTFLIFAVALIIILKRH